MQVIDGLVMLVFSLNFYELAFPGGKRDAADKSDLNAVMREIREEVGIEIEQGYYQYTNF